MPALTPEQEEALNSGKLVSFTFRHPSFARWDGMTKSQLAGAENGFMRLLDSVEDELPTHRIVRHALQQIRALLAEQDER